MDGSNCDAPQTISVSEYGSIYFSSAKYNIPVTSVCVPWILRDNQNWKFFLSALEQRCPDVTSGDFIIYPKQRTHFLDDPGT